MLDPTEIKIKTEPGTEKLTIDALCGGSGNGKLSHGNIRGFGDR